MNLSPLNIGYRCSCYSTRYCLNAIKILLFFVTISSRLLAVINADNGDEGLLGGLLSGALKGLGGGVGNLLDGKVDVVGSTVDLLNDVSFPFENKSKNTIKSPSISYGLKKCPKRFFPNAFPFCINVFYLHKKYSRKLRQNFNLSNIDNKII